MASAIRILVAAVAALIGLWTMPVRAGELASRLPVERVQQTAPPCTCRAFGRDYDMGETVCLRLGDKPALAECAMVLNNTSWRSTGRPCPEG